MEQVDDEFADVNFMLSEVNDEGILGKEDLSKQVGKSRKALTQNSLSSKSLIKN